MTEETISQSTGYLIAQVCKRHRKKAGELLAEIDLHVGQEMLLLQLWKQDGQKQSDLAQCLGIEPATVTRVLNRMARSGLIVRRADEDDRRISHICLTENGRALQDAVEEKWQELEELSMANFSVEERVLLRRFLKQLADNLGC